MLDHNIYIVYTQEDARIGLHATAMKLSGDSNLVHIISSYNFKSLYVCHTMKEAIALEKKWNSDYLANGKQRRLQ